MVAKTLWTKQSLLDKNNVVLGVFKSKSIEFSLKWTLQVIVIQVWQSESTEQTICPESIDVVK